MARPYTDWSKEELEFLRKNHTSMTKRQIAKTLERPYFGVMWMCNKMHLHKQACPFTIIEMEKRQKTMTDFERGFIAGLIEGEGCFAIRNPSRASRGLNTFYPLIEIANTDKRLLDSTQAILTRNGIKSSFGRCGVASTKNNLRRDAWKLRIGSYVMVYMLLRELEGCFVSEKNMARYEVLKKFCEVRMSKIKLNGQHHIPFTDEEIFLAGEMKRITGRSRG